MLLLLLASACSSADDRTPVRTSDAPAAATAAGKAGLAANTPPVTAQAQLGSACDSAAAFMRDALTLTPTRADGVRAASFHILRPDHGERTGCRISGTGSFAALHGDEPVGRLLIWFRKHGWRADHRVAADGPDGSTVAARQRDALCIITGSWEGHDDSEPDTIPPKAQQDQSYDLVAECARDLPSNVDLEIPDSLWTIARASGIDSTFMISPTATPVFHMGDFDGDGVKDAAVLVEHRATGKLGVAIIRMGAKQVTILGAGMHGAGPDDLRDLDEWQVFDRGVTMDLTIGYRPRGALLGDALWVNRGERGAGFYRWTGTGFVYEPRER